MTPRGHCTFQIAAIHKSREELSAILNDEERLLAAAAHHGITKDYARFYINEELRRAVR